MPTASTEEEAFKLPTLPRPPRMFDRLPVPKVLKVGCVAEWHSTGHKLTGSR